MGAPNDSSTNGLAGSLAAKTDIPSHFIGGNHLDAAPPSIVKDFVAQHNGHSVISSVSFSSNDFGSKRGESMSNNGCI